MSTIHKHISLLTPDTILSQEEMVYTEVPVKLSDTARVCIRGDLRFYVTEQEIVHGFMIGHYSIETQGMRKPLNVLWDAEGKISTPRWPATDITFNLCGAQAGQVWTYIVQVQAMEQNGQHCIVSGVFVQIFVTGKLLTL